MSDYVLGLDLGSNSIGWALVDVDGQRLAAGVRVFPEGVDRDTKGAEVSTNQTRRDKRATRRQVARRARRKRQLRQLLTTAGLLPGTENDLQALLELDPYVLRARAVEQPLTAHELGRVLLHLAQRRGFLSNRKADKSADKDSKKKPSELKAEIYGLQAELDASGQTLGQYLAQLRATAPLEAVRGKHTSRKMYRDEFERIWAAQQPHHTQRLTNGFYQHLCDKILFFQRAMYWPKASVGRCDLEPRYRRCLRADRVAQRFRLLQEVNNLRLIEPCGDVRALDEQERKTVLQDLSRHDKRTFDQLRQALGFIESQRFNLESGKRDKLQGMTTDAAIAGKKCFGPDWYERPDCQRTEIVRALLRAQEGGKGEEAAFKRRAAAEWGISAETAERMLDLSLPSGRMSFSRRAIEKLLPHLDAGLPLMTDDATPSALSAAGYLRPDQRPANILCQLPRPPKITNPLVRQALYEVRKVVNAILREYGRPARIHIELARDVKGSLEQRYERTLEMREREKQREAARDAIKEFAPAASRRDVDRYLLWKEQGELCLYTGQCISLARLYSGDVDIDHIFPWPRSLDDSFVNRVVCFRAANHEKGNQTPYEWLAERQPERFRQLLERVKHLRFNKRRRFSQQNVDLDQFINRQLTDTAYISRCVRQYLTCLGIDVVCTKGQLTADLRHNWGLNTILHSEGLNLKNREDHRHHAVDALVIALTDRSRLQQLARRRSEDLPLPWPGFREAAQQVIDNIIVSHRVRRKVSGQLHEDTIYGPTAVSDTFVFRKPLEALTLNMVNDIRDPAIRKLVRRRLREHGCNPDDKKATIPKIAWQEPLRMESGVVVKKVRVLKRDQTIQPIGDGKRCVKPGNTHHLCIFELTDAKGKTKRVAEFVTMLEAIRRARRGEPIIRRTHSEFPEARFVMSLSAGEAVLWDDEPDSRLMIFNTGASTQGQLYFYDHRDARKSDAEKYCKNANSLRAEKVAVSPLGIIRWAND